MPRAHRFDAPDAWHHVVNRGIARRTLFETRPDVRRFLALVARTVRSGLIEVHAYCILTTHFHLLVRSPAGRLSDAMQRIEDGYARWFNRSRRRDGSLFRARFRSVPIRSNAHWEATLAYIDRNPIDCHVVAVASDYPWSSARRYATDRGPRWLCRTRVEAIVKDRTSSTLFRPDLYDEAIAAGAGPGVTEWVERTLRRRGAPISDFDDLVEAAPPRVLEWMRRKAVLADGTDSRAAYASIVDLRRLMHEAQERRPRWSIRIGARDRDAWAAMRVGLARRLSGATLAEVAELEQIGESSVRRRERWHVRALGDDVDYAETAAAVAAAAIATLRGESGENGSGSVPPLRYFAR